MNIHNERNHELIKFSDKKTFNWYFYDKCAALECVFKRFYKLCDEFGVITVYPKTNETMVSKWSYPEAVKLLKWCQ